MSIMDKARELAEAIAECEELKAMRSAEARMSLDPKAQEIIQEFQEKQRDFYNIQMSGGELNEQQKAEVQQIEQRMRQNENIRNFVEAEQKFEKLLNEVNLIIAQGITGETGNNCGCGIENCSTGDCSSGCSGCN